MQHSHKASRSNGSYLGSEPLIPRPKHRAFRNTDYLRLDPASSRIDVTRHSKNSRPLRLGSRLRSDGSQSNRRTPPPVTLRFSQQPWIQSFASNHIASASDKFLADSTCSFHQLEQGEIQANKSHDGELFSVCSSGIKLDTSPREILPNGIPDLTDLMGPLAPSQVILLQPTKLAKARRRPTGSTRTEKRPEKDGILLADALNPGDKVFIDQYESSIRGRLPNSKGRERPSLQYCGGMIFFDAASRLISAHHQVSLGGVDTLRSKSTFKADAAQCGVGIQNYHVDNGVFTSAAFSDNLREAAQGIHIQESAPITKMREPNERSGQYTTWLAP